MLNFSTSENNHLNIIVDCSSFSARFCVTPPAICAPYSKQPPVGTWKAHHCSCREVMLRFSVHQTHPDGSWKCGFLGTISLAFGLVDLGWEFAFLTAFQVTLMLLFWGPNSENHWPTESGWKSRHVCVLATAKWILARYQKIPLDLDKKWLASKQASKKIQESLFQGCVLKQ